MKPDDVRMARFPKVHFGGYDMESVDAFLAKVETDLKEKEKEINILRQKIKVLVEEVKILRKEKESKATQAATIDEIEYLRSLFDTSEPYCGKHLKKDQWICKYCETINDGHRTTCIVCGKEQ